MSTNEFSIVASMENLPGMVDFVKSSLEKCRLDKKQVMKTVLLAEDMLAELIQHRAADDSVVSIKIENTLSQSRRLSPSMPVLPHFPLR